MSFFSVIKSPTSDFKSPFSSSSLSDIIVTIVGIPFPLRVCILGVLIFKVVSGNTILASSKTTSFLISLAKRDLYL